MPIKHAAEKSLRQSKKNAVVNRTVKENIRKLLKKARNAVIEGKIEEARQMVTILSQAVDKAAKRNIIKANSAARIKSRFAASIKKIATKK